jgi:hypothetical protein
MLLSRLSRLLLLTSPLLTLCHGPPVREYAAQRFHARRQWREAHGLAAIMRNELLDAKGQSRRFVTGRSCR